MFWLSQKKRYDRKLPIEKVREENYKECMTKSVEQLKDELVNLNELIIDANLMIEAVTDAIWSKSSNEQPESKFDEQQKEMSG